MENQEQTLWKRLRHTYRLVVMNNETFEEVGSYRLSLLNLYVLLSVIVVVVATSIWLLVAFTPARQYIPGYSNGNFNEAKLVELNNKLTELEELTTVYQRYTDNFRKVLTGKVITSEINEEARDTTDESAKEVTPIREDSLLRQELELEAIGLRAQELGRRINFSSNRPPEQLYVITPIQGEISKEYDPDEGHYGVDFIAPSNTPIRSAMDGYVFFADWTMETGNTIGIQHANNMITFYKHNSALLKKLGDYVKAGEAVAVIGNTGTLTDGPHLHFELWFNGTPVNPTEYISL